MKGLAFSIDALYAVLLVSLFLTGSALTNYLTDDVSFLNKMGNDLLSSLEKSNYFTFFSQPDNIINQNLDTILSKLPVNVNGKITLEKYKPVQGVMQLEKTWTRQDAVQLTESVAIKRAVPDIDNDRYYLIKLVLWYE